MKISQEFYSSLYEAIAWIMFRTEMDAKFARDTKQPSDTQLFILSLLNKKHHHIEFNNATRILLSALQAAKIIAYGSKHDNKTQEIPFGEWRDLEISVSRHYPNTAYFKQSAPSKPEWKNILFVRDEVLALFPSRNIKRKNQKAQKLDTGLSPRHRAWAKKYYDELKSQGIRTNRNEDLKALRLEFPKANREISRILRQEFVPEWGKPGRPNPKAV